MRKMKPCIRLFLVIALMPVVCTACYSENHAAIASEKTTDDNIMSPNNSIRFEDEDAITDFAEGEEKEYPLKSPEDESQRVAEIIREIDFSIKNNPIDSEKYTPEMDKIFKAAYLKAITNIAPIKRSDSDETIFFQDLLRGKPLTENEFQDFILKPAKYYYTDFDGDGLPELGIEADGPTILKYIPGENQVYVYIRTHDKWHILGTGQLYYFDPTSANTVTYIYELLDSNGNESLSVTFMKYSEYNEKTSTWEEEKFIDVNGYINGYIDGRNNVLVSEEIWNEITKPFFEAIENPISSYTYEELFKDGNTF